jgi:hypothetical protein
MNGQVMGVQFQAETTDLPSPSLGHIRLPIHRVPAVLSAGVKHLEREAGNSYPSSNEDKNEWSRTSIPHTSSWRGE